MSLPAALQESFDLAAGSIAGKFRVERSLALTPASATYLVTHLLLGYAAVLKLPHDPDDAAREARALSSIQNPHIPALLETGIFHDGVRSLAYLIEEHVSGQTLSRWMATYRRMDALRVVRIGLKVASALAALHRAGFVHGDVKPDNIVVDPMLEGERVALVDLGAARQPAREGASVSSSRLMATPGYAAPELHSGQFPSPASDVYSLALVLYEALSGGSVGRCVNPSKLPALSLVVPMCKRLSGVLERALSPDPGVRFPDAAAFAHELSSLDPGELARYPGSSESLSPVYQDAQDTLDMGRHSNPPLQEASTGRPRNLEPPTLLSTLRPSLWFLADDAATDQLVVRSIILRLREHYDVRLLPTEARDRARVELGSGAPPPWVVVFGDDHVARRDALLDVLTGQGETMRVYLTDTARFDRIALASERVGLDGVLCLDTGADGVMQELSFAAARAARVRRCYDTLRLALGDCREDLVGLRRSLDPVSRRS